MDNENDGGDECQPTTSNTNGLCPIFQMSFFFIQFNRCKQFVGPMCSSQ